MEKEKNKITAQCIGIVLVCFAIGMFTGSWIYHINSINQVQGFNITNEEYYLGGTDSSDYRIDFNKNPDYDTIKQCYKTEGVFTNTTEGHMKSVKLNFSLLDKDGNKIYGLTADCTGLHPGQSWKFLAISQNDLRGIPECSIMLDSVIIEI